MTIRVRPQGRLEFGPLAGEVIVADEAIVYFEGFRSAGTQGWAAGPGAIVARDVTYGRTATGSLRMHTPAGSGAVYAERVVSDLEVGRTYTLEAWVRSPAGFTVSVGVDGIGSGSTAAGVDGSFINVTYTFTATGTSHTLRCNATVNTVDFSYWDDITLIGQNVATDTPILPAEEGSVRLDALRVPYATARVVLPIVDPTLPELIDPRDGVRATLTGEDREAGTLRVFDLSVRGRTVNHENKTIEIELASDEAILQAYAPGVDDDGARAYETSLRGVCNYVLDKIDANLGPDFTDRDITAAWEVTNLVGNPSFESNANGWSSTTLSSIARSTSVTAAFGAGYCNQTSAGAGIASMQRDETINVTAGETYTLSAYMRPNTSGLQGRLYIRWISSSGTAIRESLGTVSGLSTSSWTRVHVTAKAPKNAVSARMVLGASFTGAGQVNRVDAVMFAEGELTTYVDGSLPADTYYSYAWDDGADSTSTRYPFVERDPDMFVWPAGVSAWEFLQPLVAAGGMRLFCQENRVWRLIDPANFAIPDVVTLSPDFVSEGTDRIGLDDPDVYCTGVLVRYTWTGTRGVQKTRDDFAGDPGQILLVELARPWPGDGVAAWMLARRNGRGRVQEVTAITRWDTSPGMQVSITLPGTLTQEGQVEGVEWGLTDGLMRVTSTALTDIIPGTVNALVGTVDSLVGTINDL